MAPPVIISAEYADHENEAANVTYDKGGVKYVVMHSNSKHKRDLDAWVAEGNEIAPCPLPPGMVEQQISRQIEALEERLAEAEEKITGLEEAPSARARRNG